MKKIVLLTIIMLLILSCSEDFLERVPNTSTVIQNYYTTPEDAGEALTAIYNMLLRDDWWSSIIFSEIASDNCAGGAGTGDGGRFQRTDRGLQQPEADANQTAWITYYGGIYRANIYLEYENLIDWTDNEDLRLQYKAEAKFLRAYFHLYLTRMFGEIPAFGKLNAPDEVPPRTPAEDIFALIIDDLKFCAEHGLSDPYPAMDPENWGRATKWAAEALIGRAFLFYTGYYNDPDIKGFTAQDARGYIDDAINNSGHDLVNQFASLWRVPAYSELGDINEYAGEINPEVIWSIRYNIMNRSNQEYGGHWMQRMVGPRSTNIDPYGQGWGATPVLPEFWNAFDTADLRRTATILSWDDEGITYNWTLQQQAQYTGYSLKKYELASISGTPENVALGGSDWQWDGFEDYIVIRFADVLLMGAELHVITSGENNATALNYINRVRSRAFGNISDYNYPTLDIDDILTERRFELAGEHSRYWDILRSCKGDFSKLVSILTYVDNSDEGDFSNTSHVQSLDVDGNNFAAIRGLFQIPQNELDLMEGIIEQNPGFTSD